MKPRFRWLITATVAFLLMAANASAFYDPGLQRWINRDPIAEAGGINLFKFVGGDSVNHLDSYGECPLILAIPWIAGTTAEALFAGAAVGTTIAGTTLVIAGALDTPYPSTGGFGNPVGPGHSIVNAPPITIVGPIVVAAIWAGDTGAEEWGLRNGVGGREGKRRFHDIKKGDNMSTPPDKYGVDPETGEVFDPEGNPIGNLG